MEACTAVEKELNKVLAKLDSIGENGSRTITDLTDYIQSIQTDLAALPEEHELTADQLSLVLQAIGKVQSTIQSLTSDHRSLHSTVSKVGKAIDQNFVADYASTSREDVFSIPEKDMLLNRVICQHFSSQGMFDIADQFASEAGLNSENKIEPSTRLDKIWASLKRKDLDQVLEWAEQHRADLVKQVNDYYSGLSKAVVELHIGDYRKSIPQFCPVHITNSSLEFKIHQLRFISLVEKGISCQKEAIQYARTYLKKFVETHKKDVQRLMGMLLFLVNGVSNSPYKHFLQTDLWADLQETFSKESASLLGPCIESALSICVSAGCTSLPALMNIKEVMQQQEVSNIWNGRNELPIEIDLGPEKQFHSVFACPILKQQCTDVNPPMRLACGHVISKEALNELIASKRFRCPYCPLEQDPADAKVIYF